MLRIVEDTIKAATPHLLGVDGIEDLPPPDPQAAVDFTNLLSEQGIFEFSLVTNLAFLVLNLVSLITRGHTFPGLTHAERSSLIERILSSKGRVSIVFTMFITIPVYNSYYARPDVMKILGFDIIALKEESELRHVTRDKDLPPKPGEELEPEAAEEVSS